MLRKMLTVGALALVALVFGVGAASAKPLATARWWHGNADASQTTAYATGFDGFSDGRFAR